MRKEKPISKTAIVYCRVSTSKQDQDGTSLDTQAAACIKHAESLGYKVGRVTKEVYSGAKLWDRPQLAKDRADVKAGQFQAIVCYAIDRLSRDIAHLAIISEECERAGARLLFVTENLDDSPQGKLMRSVQSYVAEVEREKIKERTQRGKRAKIMSGKILPSRKALFGYVNVDGKREIKPDEAATVRQMFEWVIEGCGILHVRRRLFERNILPPEGRRYPDGHARHWPTSTIQKVLRDPAYKGETFAFQFRAATKDNPRRMRPRSEHVKLSDGLTPPIVSAEVWEAAQQRLNTNKGDTYRNAKHQYLLRGLAVCAVCGHRMYSDSTGRFRYYRCSSRKLERGPCGCGLVPADAVESAVWEHIARMLADPQIIVREIKRQRQTGPDPQLKADREAAIKRRAKLDGDMLRLARRLRDTESDDLAHVYEREIIQVQAEAKRLDEAIAEIDARLSAARKTIANLQSLSDYCAKVAKAVSTFSFYEKRLALEAFGASVTLNGLEWTLETRLPFGQPISPSKRCGLRICFSL
jgi:site-specific DNA recombinase